MDVAREFGRVIGPLRRAVLRTRYADDLLPDLSEAQIEVLRALEITERATPGELAASLRVARSTISNLLRTMTAAGLVLREPSSADLRTVEVSLSPLSRDLLARYDRVSTTALRRAIDALGPDDRAALEGALPALHALLGTLDSEQRGDPASRSA